MLANDAIDHIENIQISKIIGSKIQSNIADDVVNGLLHDPKLIPPKYLYDEVGSQLFDQICDTPEYYPTRAEHELLKKHARDILNITKPVNLLELGSGTSRKTKALLRHWQKFAGKRVYWPLDVSEEILLKTAKQLAKEFPALQVHALVGDYTSGLNTLPSDISERKLALFLGGTIGNFAKNDATNFLSELKDYLNTGDYLLLGTDCIKEKTVLNDAYNDKQRVTERFNKNILNVINKHLDGNFDVDAFRHIAYFNENCHQIEMYLEAAKNQTVKLNDVDMEIKLTEGERILTEVSRKFTRQSIQELLTASGFEMVKIFQSSDNYYALTLATVR